MIDHTASSVRQTCCRPCPTATEHGRTIAILRAHLMEYPLCADAWIALARLQTDQRRRLDCLTRAAMLAPEDAQVQSDYLECRLQLDPQNQDVAGWARRLRVQRAIDGVVPNVFRRMQRVRALGEILVEWGALSDHELRLALAEQHRRQAGEERVLLGDLLVAKKLVTPHVLARALMEQLGERMARGDMPQALGEYLVQEHHISPADLERALSEQTRLRQLGRHETIGKILLRHGAISVAMLKRALERQRDDALAAFL
jgi:hypothetical protein